MNIEKLIHEGATVIDVRTKGEFDSTHAPNTINIPLGEIQDRLEEIRSFDKPLVLCCLSGGRSGQACGFLQSQGIDCSNAGSWMDVNNLMSQKVG